MILIPKHTMLKPHGTVIATACDGPEYQRDTVQCVHCGAHGIYSPGCGSKLGRCSRCAGPTCPNRKCGGDCLGPLEQRLDLYEAGKLSTL